MSYLGDILLDINARLATAQLNGFWNDTQNARWIYQGITRVWNYAYRDPNSNKIVMANWPFTIKVDTESETVANQEDYDIPEDCRETGGILYLKIDGSVVHNVTDQEYETGEHSYDRVYVVRGNKYHILENGYPPTTAGQTLEVTYVSNPPRPKILKRGNITVYASGGTGITTVTSTSHGLDVGDYVTIMGSAHYSGTHEILAKNTDTFNIPAIFQVNEGRGTWLLTEEMPTPEHLDEAIAKIAFGTCLAKASKKGEGNAEISEAVDLVLPYAIAKQDTERLGYKGIATSTLR